MDRSRRDLLLSGTLLGCLGLSGCLRLTDSSDDSTTTGATPSGTDTVTRSTRTTTTDEPPETATDEPSTETSEPADVVECTSDSVPTDTAAQFTHPFADSRNSFASPGQTAPPEPPCIAWEREVPYRLDRVNTGPVLTTQHVIFYDNDAVTGYARSDGSRAWRATGTPTGGIQRLKPLGVLENGFVAFIKNDRSANLEAVSIGQDGSSQTVRTVVEGERGDFRMRTGRLFGSRLYLVFGDDPNDATRVVALDWPSGDRVWDRTIGSTGLRVEDISVDADTIVLTSDETDEDLDNVWALSTEDGSVLWSTRLPIGEGVPITDENNLYLPIQGYGNDDLANQVRAMSKSTGEPVWTFEVTNPPRNGVAASGGRVYVVADNELFALAADSGQPQWRFTPPEAGIGGAADGLPIVCQNTLLLGGNFRSAPGRIRAVDRTTGELQWSIAVPGEGVQSPIPGDGALYTAAEVSGSEPQLRLYCLY